VARIARPGLPRHDAQLTGGGLDLGQVLGGCALMSASGNRSSRSSALATNVHRVG
jgi:hypothetical protein